MQRRPRAILLFFLIVAPIAPARGDATLTQIAQRFAAPAEVSAEASAVAPATAAPVEGAPLESRPLGPASSGARQPIHSRNSSNSLTGSGSWIMDTLTALGVVVGLILAARWAYMRFVGGAGPVRTSPVVEVLARTAVAPRNHVLLLRVGSRILLVSDSSGGMRTLADIDDPEEVASLIGAVSAARDNSLTKNFTRLLQGFNGQYERERVGDEGADDAEHSVDRARDSISSLLARVRLLGDRGGVA